MACLVLLRWFCCPIPQELLHVVTTSKPHLRANAWLSKEACCVTNTHICATCSPERDNRLSKETCWETITHICTDGCRKKHARKTQKTNCLSR